MRDTKAYGSEFCKKLEARLLMNGQFCPIFNILFSNLTECRALPRPNKKYYVSGSQDKEHIVAVIDPPQKKDASAQRETTLTKS